MKIYLTKKGIDYTDPELWESYMTPYIKIKTSDLNLLKRLKLPNAEIRYVGRKLDYSRIPIMK